MARVSSFPPIANDNARVLILGSMPGVKSLRANQYYANPQNTFWRILGACCGFDPALPYTERARRLCARGIALWDVLQSCHRDGSLDSDIDAATARANDFVGFLATHRRIGAVLCNGQPSLKLFKRLVLPKLGERVASLSVHCMPSTSPAHAQMTPARKLAAWRAALGEFLR